MARYSWKRGPSYDGLRRLADTYRLQFGGKHLATAQKIDRSETWFWYSEGWNTAHRPDTLENVKAEAVNHFRQLANAE